MTPCVPENAYPDGTMNKHAMSVFETAADGPAPATVIQSGFATPDGLNEYASAADGSVVKSRTG